VSEVISYFYGERVGMLRFSLCAKRQLSEVLFAVILRSEATKDPVVSRAAEESGAIDNAELRPASPRRTGSFASLRMTSKD
jgi:hypothetical protein